VHPDATSGSSPRGCSFARARTALVRSHNVPSRSKRIACGVTTRGICGRSGKRSGSFRLAFPTGGKDGPLTFDLLFSLQARLQHLEFLCQRAKLAQHVGSPLPTQRLCASDQQKLTRHRWEDPTIRPFTAERHFVAVNYSREKHSAKFLSCRSGLSPRSSFAARVQAGACCQELCELPALRLTFEGHRFRVSRRNWAVLSPSLSGDGVGAVRSRQLRSAASCLRPL